MTSSSVLTAHARQDIFTRTQRNKQGEWNKPYADAEEGGNLRKCRHVWDLITVIVGCGGRGRVRKMAKPQDVVDEHEDWAHGKVSISVFDSGLTEQKQVVSFGRLTDRRRG